MILPMMIEPTEKIGGYMEAISSPEPGKRGLRGKVILAAQLALLACYIVWSYIGAEIKPLDLVKDSGNMVILARDFFPPDFRDFTYYLKEMLTTIHIAFWGTLFALICSVPLGIMSSENVVSPWIYQPVRRVMDACRAINEMVFAMLFVVTVGLGAFAGVLALWIHTTGVLAKLFSEAVEAVDPGPVEGIRSTGAGLISEVWYGILPQVFPLWISFTLYRFESNVRSATVVGMVGAGGIGVVLWELIRGFMFTKTCTVMLVIILAVSAFDLLSQYLRKKFI
jgi:phosphonate transport system permease protein